MQIQARGIEFAEPIWPAPIKEYSEALDFENLVFKGKFSVEIPIEKISPDYDTSTTNVDFGYQACSNICLAPQSVHASLEIKSLQSKLSESAPLKKNSESENSSSENAVAFLLVLAFMP